MKTWLALSLIVNILFVLNWLSNRKATKMYYDLDELKSGDRIIIDKESGEVVVEVLDNDPNLMLITLREKDRHGNFDYRASYRDEIFQNRIPIS